MLIELAENKMKEKMARFILENYPGAELDTYVETKFGIEYLFYPTAKAMEAYTCVLKNGKLVILTDF